MRHLVCAWQEALLQLRSHLCFFHAFCPALDLLSIQHTWNRMESRSKSPESFESLFLCKPNFSHLICPEGWGNRVLERAWSCLIRSILRAHIHPPAPHCSQHPLPGVAVLSPAEERLSQCSLFLQAQDWLTLGRICWCSLTTHTLKGNRAHTHKNSFVRIAPVGFLSQQAIRAKGRCCYICASN